MKKPLLLLGILFLALTTTVTAQERNCAAMEDLEQRLLEDPTLEQRMQEIENFTQLKVAEMEQNRSVDGDIITIPVVIHVLYNNSTTNISNAQIQSQLDVLNEDFRRTNSDADNTWAQAADTQIQFCLATVDPNGNATTGITRKSTAQQDWYQNTNNMKKSSQGGISPWNTAEYLNMWTVPRLLRSNGDVLLGFAQFPGGPAATDGVVMGYNYFGSTGAVSAPFDLGRTTTHEVGHFLNLRHIWGDGPCGADDFVTDTPESDASNGGCNTSHVSCGSVDMVQNYMDYSNDSCMNLFTQGQTNRMRATLVAGGVRRTLALSSKCGAANPTPTCTDGIQNGDETGIDCGGSSCAPCQTQIACATTISSFPYSESFESGTGAWSQSTADNINWTRDSSGTPSRGTGPSNGAAGSWYMYVEASGNGTGYPNKRAILDGPCFDLTGKSGADFSFSYHQYGANDMGRIDVEASIDGSNWTSLWNKTGNQGNSWNAQTINLDSYAGQTVKLRFNRITGGTWKADIAIDNIAVTAAGGGGNPTPPTGYCSSNGNNTNDEFIQRVQMGSINNSTGASSGGYGDFTNQSTNLNSNNTITITPQWTGTVYSEGYAVWVDWNRDGDFGDSGELVYSRTATQATSVSGSFSVPSGASAGPTRMRVSMKYNGVPTSCESFQYGEVEDYTVVIPGAGRDGKETFATNKMTIYPNPVKGNTLNVSLLQGGVNYVIYNISGQVMDKGTHTGTVDVASLSTGIYLIEVSTETERFIERFIKE